MKNTIIASVLFLAAGSVMAAEGAPSAGATTPGSLSFSWTGTVPTTPQSTGDWEFQDALGEPFAPASATLLLVKDKGAIKINSERDISFFITSKSGSNLNRVSAYLAQNPQSIGFTLSRQFSLSSNVNPQNGEVAIIVNNKPLNVGSAQAVELDGVSGSPQVPVNIALAASAAENNVTEGAVVGFNANVVFSVAL
ncbi:hypothetical protein [Aeromonas veronii]|uniref:hypothetical protein n=1 Tax=Aeromonas veronii TaxID=654 RepID=UPI003D23EFB1